MADGTYCRDYYTKSTIEGAPQISSGFACRKEGGRWVVDRKL